MILERTYSVWSYRDDAEWLASHAGVPDVLLVPMLTLDNAHHARERIEMIAPGRVIEIRDVKGLNVTTRLVRDNGNSVSHAEIVSTGPRPARPTPPPSRPARRRLGTREE